jgi:tetratricopeptide (TPR) repeat protein
LGHDALNQARVLWARGDFRSAREALGQLLGSDPPNPGALLLNAHLLLEDREEEEALRAYREAVTAAPGSAEAWNGLARCLHALAREPEALDAARKAQALLGEGDNFRETGPVYLTLVWCLRSMRQFREALLAAEEGLARSPDAVLAQWASVVEEEFAESEKEEC